jgi:hypothetical protein
MCDCTYAHQETYSSSHRPLYESSVTFGPYVFQLVELAVIDGILVCRKCVSRSCPFSYIVEVESGISEASPQRDRKSLILATRAAEQANGLPKGRYSTHCLYTNGGEAPSNLEVG